MEPEGSLPNSQEPTTCPYPERDRSSPYPNIPLLEDPILIIIIIIIYYNYFYPPIYAWILRVISSHQISPSKTCIDLSSHLYVLHVPPISFFSIWSPELYWVRLLSSSICSFLHYLVPPRPKYLRQHPILEHPQPPFLPKCERPSFMYLECPPAGPQTAPLDQSAGCWRHTNTAGKNTRYVVPYQIFRALCHQSHHKTEYNLTNPLKTVD